MTLEVIANPLTTQAKMEGLFSSIGIELRGDDDGDRIIESDVIQDAIDYASDTVFMYTLDWYADTSLATSTWVQRRATIIACWYFSQRRGNPANFQSLYDITIQELEKVQTGKLRIPRLPWRSDLSGGVSNFRVDDRYVVRKTRLERLISTGGRSSKQDVDRTVWNDNFVLP